MQWSIAVKNAKHVMRRAVAVATWVPRGLWFILSASGRLIAWLASGIRSAFSWLRRKLSAAARSFARWTRALFVCPPFDQHCDYHDAKEWLGKFAPVLDREGYDKALEYAWKRYEQAGSASETLDKKADNLLRNAGLVAGLLGIGINAFRIDTPALLVPSLILFTASMFFGAIACNPAAGATSASVQDLLDDITAGHTSDAWVAASIHLAIVGRTCGNEWKAQRIRWSTAAFCLGLLAFLLPISWLYLRPYVLSWLPWALN
jgi:hypothetical protein